jgi:hypothetical protein
MSRGFPRRRNATSAHINSHIWNGGRAGKDTKNNGNPNMTIAEYDELLLLRKRLPILEPKLLRDAQSVRSADGE